MELRCSGNADGPCSTSAGQGRRPRLRLPVPCTCDSAALSPGRSHCQQIPAPGLAHCGLAQRMVLSSVTSDPQLQLSGKTHSQLAKLP